MKAVVRFLIAVMLLLEVSSASLGGKPELWHVTFDTRWLGPMEAHVQIERDAAKIRGTSLSGAASILGELPGDHDVSGGVMIFEAMADESGGFSGTFVAPWQEGELKLTITDDTLEGTVEGGALAGTVSGRKVDGGAPLRDYVAILEDLDKVVASKVFSPDDLLEPGYLEFRSKLGEIAELATDDLDLLFGFHWAWQNDPFSHFQFKRSHQTAEQMFAFFDSYRVGFEAATVEFDGETPILKVRTMMGADTIEQIEAAYRRIAQENPKTLIVDLRENGGGAFAVKPLVEHVIDEPVDAGFFLSQVWNRDHDRAPTAEEALAAPPWHGWSIISFWKDVQEKDIVRVQFQPAEPNFDGEAYVLLDEKSASATELAADAFRASGVATLVGKQTAGHMLSQSMFDVADKFVVSLPVADYYSIKHGRIEGQGVPVDVEAESAEAFDVARSLLERSSERD